MSGAPISKVLLTSTSAFLLVAPLSGSAGLRAAALIVGVVALVAGALRGSLRDAPRFPRPLLFSCLAWAALAVASLAWSVDPRESLSELRGELLYGALALVLFFHAARDLERFRTWVAALALGCVAVIVAQGVQTVAPFWRNRLDGGGGAWSTHLVLAAPLLLTLSWPRPWGIGMRQGALAACLAALLLAGWASENRMLWVAFAVQLAACALLWRHMPAMEPERFRSIQRFMAVMAAVLLVAFGAMVVERNAEIYGGPITTHLERDLRPAIWRVAVDTIREAPVWGHGFGREIKADVFRKVGPPGWPPEIHHAHNIFADVAVQLGLAGLVVFVAMMAALAAAHVRLLASVEAAPLGLIGLVVLAGFLTKNLTDDFFHRHNAQVFWAVNGLLLGLGGRLARRT